MLKILLLSDIHFIHCEDDENDYRSLETAFIEAMDDIRDSGGLDQILICGDIASKGRDGEYQKAESFLKSVYEKLGCDEKQTQLYVVPGNHDVNRETNKSARFSLRSTLLDKLQADSFIQETKHSGVETLILLYSPLKEFHKFANMHSSLDGIAEAISSGSSNFNNRSFRKEVQLGIINDYVVKLHCLNSAMICDKDDVKDPHTLKDGEHKLYIPKSAYNVDTDRTFVNISLMHHPLAWFNDEVDLQKEFDHKFKLQIFGHVHQQSISQDEEGKSSVRLQVGSLQPGFDGDSECYNPVYNILELDIVGNVLKIKVKCFSWNGDDFVKNDRFSYLREVALKKKSSRTDKQKKEIKKMKAAVINPDYIYALRYRLFNSEHIKEVIRDIMPNAYNEEKEEYVNAMLFFKAVSSNKEIITKLETTLNKYGD